MRLEESAGKRDDRRGAAPDGTRQAPLYALITDVLRRALASGSIEQGVVLLEGPVAGILRSTRTPVRQALQELEQEGLVSRFDGRGYLAGGAGTAPRRTALSAAMLGMDEATQPVRKTLGWEALHEAVERDVVLLSIFDRWRLNEMELARHFGVGRMVARDVLVRLEGLGLIEKDARQRWLVAPLDADRISHLYELRWLLEPVALAGAAATTPRPELDAMAAALEAAIAAYPKVTRAAMDALEQDLHVTLLARCPNKDLLQSLQRTRSILTLSKHVLGAAVPMPRRDPFMAEHVAVLAALRRGDVGAAQAALREHLEDSCGKVTRRVELARRSVPTPKVPYTAAR